MEDKFLETLTELVKEFTLQKKEERVKSESRAQKEIRSNIWDWFKENTTSISALISVLAIVFGGMWTLYQFNVQQQQRLQQQQREDLLRRQELIIASLDDLNDPAKRVNAVYA